MNRIKSAIENYLKYIGTVAFSLYCYYEIKTEGKKRKILLNTIVEESGISRGIVILKNKILKKYKLIDITKKLENGKKYYFIRSMKPTKRPVRLTHRISTSNVPIIKNAPLRVTEPINAGAFNVPLYTYIYNNNNINIKDTKSNIYNKVNKANKVIKDDIHKYLEFVYKKILQIPRYNNDYYKKRKVKLSEKEYENVKRLKSYFNENEIDGYIEWWARTKLKKIHGFSFGILATQPMIEEYLIKVKGVDPDGESKQKIRDTQVREGVKRTYINVLKHDLDLKNIKEDEIEIIEKAILLGVLKKSKGEYKIIEKHRIK